MSDSLERALWVQRSQSKKAEDPDERVREALAKALEATTPEHPGAPWDKEDEVSSDDRRGWHIPQGDGH
jgi:hypothetical protein